MFPKQNLPKISPTQNKKELDKELMTCYNISMEVRKKGKNVKIVENYEKRISKEVFGQIVGV